MKKSYSKILIKQLGTKLIALLKNVLVILYILQKVLKIIQNWLKNLESAIMKCIKKKN